jgi:hypothetical protein
VLPYAAVDALHIGRRRLEGICAAAQLTLQELDVQVITAPTVQLDLPADRAKLEHTVEELKPRLLVSDPFVRLHRIDENSSGEVAPLLAYLRPSLTRAAATSPPGCARRSSCQKGWRPHPRRRLGDSNLYLRRLGNELTLTVEHRAAPSVPPIHLELAQCGGRLLPTLRAIASERWRDGWTFRPDLS